MRVYDLQQWKRTRAEQLAREPLCKHHLLRGMSVPAAHVDHIIRIEKGGDWFDPSNLQSLCPACHSVKTLGDKGHTVRMGCDTEGNPIDPTHPWVKKG